MGWQLLASETILDFCKNVLRKVLDFLFVCVAVWKSTCNITVWREGEIKNFPLRFSLSFYSHFAVEQIQKNFLFSPFFPLFSFL